jgi:hypothetical protein
MRLRSPAARQEPSVGRLEGRCSGARGPTSASKEYLALHSKLEGTLPALPKEATPEQIDKRQRELGTLIRNARKGAKRGALFTPATEAYVKRAFAKTFSGSDGKLLKASIMDENPNLPSIVVNERYPDEVPFSTMPPEVLTVLPKLEEDIEYRFIGDRLILFDSHAHISGLHQPGPSEIGADDHERTPPSDHTLSRKGRAALNRPRHRDPHRLRDRGPAWSPLAAAAAGACGLLLPLGARCTPPSSSETAPPVVVVAPDSAVEAAGPPSQRQNSLKFIVFGDFGTGGRPSTGSPRGS